MQPAADGGALVVGSTDSFGAGGTDGFVLRLDALGNVVLARTVGSLAADKRFKPRTNVR